MQLLSVSAYEILAEEDQLQKLKVPHLLTSFKRVNEYLDE